MTLTKTVALIWIFCDAFTYFLKKQVEETEEELNAVLTYSHILKSAKFIQILKILLIPLPFVGGGGVTFNTGCWAAAFDWAS